MDKKLELLESKIAEAKLGGGQNRIEKQHAELKAHFDDKVRIIQAMMGEAEKQRELNASLTAELEVAKMSSEERGRQIKDLKADLREARGQNKQLQADLLDLARGGS